jgi:hypothetical protein
MSVDDLEQRFSAMVQRLDEVYDGIGHSTGRPYLYFVYPPDKDQLLRRLADEQMNDGTSLIYLHIDLVQITIEVLRGQEAKRAEHLNDPNKRDDAGNTIVRLWARQLEKKISAYLASFQGAGRPVVVLRGMAALYPLGNPTHLMEASHPVCAAGAGHPPASIQPHLRLSRSGKRTPLVLPR